MTPPIPRMRQLPTTADIASEVRRAMVDEVGDVANNDLDELERLTIERFSTDPEKYPERAKQIDEHRANFLRDKFPQVEAVFERVLTRVANARVSEVSRRQEAVPPP